MPKRKYRRYSPGFKRHALRRASEDGVTDKSVCAELQQYLRKTRALRRQRYKTLTWDRGKQVADHQRFSLATDIDVYFCDPQHPWQRGLNENTIGLLWQYFPKGMGLLNVHQNRLSAVAKRLNDRPRKTLGYYSPAENFYESVVATD